VADSGEGRTLQDCAGERPGLNTSIMLHLGTALRAYYDGLSSPPVPHDVINAAVPVDRQVLSACDPASCEPESFDLGCQLDQGERLGALGLAVLRCEATSADIVEQVGIGDEEWRRG